MTLQPLRPLVFALLSWCVLAPAAMSLAAPASATTWFVRTDGGDDEQCNGRADAPYPGSGNGEDCAWKHPNYALPTNDRPRIEGGDTLMIGSGEYMIGSESPGFRPRACAATAGASTTATPAAPPSGQPDAKTRILGAGHDTGCKAPPKLWGTNRVDIVLNLRTPTTSKSATWRSPTRAIASNSTPTTPCAANATHRRSGNGRRSASAPRIRGTCGCTTSTSTGCRSRHHRRRPARLDGRARAHHRQRLGGLGRRRRRRRELQRRPHHVPQRRDRLERLRASAGRRASRSRAGRRRTAATATASAPARPAASG